MDLNIDDATLELPIKTCALLESFMRRPGVVLSRLRLLEDAWDSAYESRSNVVDVQIRRLRERIDELFVSRRVAVELLLPYSQGARLAELHEIAGELEREDTADGVRVRALLPPDEAERFARFAVAGR